MTTETPFYHLVPKDFEANVRFRKRMLEEARADEKAAEELFIMCSRDPLFYVNTFVWTYDPLRYGINPVRPFLTFDAQDQALIELNNGIGRHDVLIKKSRDMGATWLVLVCFEWRWHFMDYQSFLIASRNESYVDEPGNEKTLFAKLDFIHKHQPRWLRPRRYRTQGRLENQDTRSTINGESATGDLGRGDRRTAILWDEVAAWDRSDGYRAESSTLSTTACRVIVSTPQGIGNIYADKAVGSSPTKNQITLHWSKRPYFAHGLYTSKNGKLQILDKNPLPADYEPLRGYKFPDNYPFVLDGKLRSIWYDWMCERTPIPSVIAQEIDIDFLGSGAQFFDQPTITRCEAEMARRPYFSGELSYDSNAEPGGFMESPQGHLRLWIHPNAAGEIAKGREFVLGADISAGTGASDTVFSIGDRQTGEKVAEFCCNRTRPEEAAKYAVALARWFNNAFMIWEANGPGRQFGAQVLDLGYRNIYYRHDEQKFPKKPTQVPGFYSTKDTKRNLLTDYGLALGRGNFINRSTESFRQCAEIVFLDDGSVGHVRSASSGEPSGSGENHGDRVIADALCCKGMRERPYEAKAVPDEPPIGSLAERRKRWAAEERMKQSAMVF